MSRHIGLNRYLYWLNSRICSGVLSHGVPCKVRRTVFLNRYKCTGGNNDLDNNYSISCGRQHSSSSSDQNFHNHNVNIGEHTLELHKKKNSIIEKQCTTTTFSDPCDGLEFDMLDEQFPMHSAPLNKGSEKY